MLVLLLTLLLLALLCRYDPVVVTVVVDVALAVAAALVVVVDVVFVSHPILLRPHVTVLRRNFGELWVNGNFFDWLHRTLITPLIRRTPLEPQRT